MTLRVRPILTLYRADGSAAEAGDVATFDGTRWIAAPGVESSGAALVFANGDFVGNNAGNILHFE